MIKNILLILVMSLLIACSDKNENKKFGALTEEVKTLRTENAKLLKNKAKVSVSETGTISTVVMSFTVLLFINNFIWVIFYRRRK